LAGRPFCQEDHIVSRSYRRGERASRPFAHLEKQETFRCRHCKLMVGQPPSGGRHRNHCPYCLYSRHVDEHTPGDRASACGASMAPEGVFTRPDGEQALVHRCLGCGIVRHNRLAADDLDVLVLDLPDLTVLPARHREDSRTA
jgi:hypothetical protein